MRPTSIAVRSVTFDLARLVTSVAKKFSLQAAQKEVALRIHVGTGLESYGDPMKLSWVLSTLIGNALRYTPEGGSVEVSADRSGEALRLSVSDSGPGIPLEVSHWSSSNLVNGLEMDLKEVLRLWVW
jgi:signal transduction histidine kinase